MEENIPFDASDEAGVAGRERKARGGDRDLDRALRSMLADPQGRRVLAWIVRDLAGWFDRTFTGNSTTFFNEGRRQVGTGLVERLLKLDPRALGDLITEMTERTR